MKRSVQAVAFSIAAASLLSACGGNDDAGGEGGESVELKVADHFPESNPHAADGSLAFIDHLEGAAPESVDLSVQYLGAEQLAGADELFNAVRDGTTDIAAAVMSYVTTEIPEAEVAQLPGAFGTAEEGAQAFWELVNGPLQEKFIDKGTRPLFGTCLPPYQIATTEKKLGDPADVEGMPLRSSGGAVTLTIEKLGGTPVELPAPEMYLAMQRGTVEGALAPISSLPSYKIEEVADYTTTNLALGSACTVWLINEEVWGGLSSDTQDAIVEAAELTQADIGKAMDEADVASADALTEGGVELYEVPDVAAFEARLGSVAEEWASDADSKGYEGTATLDAWREITGAE